MRLFCGAAAVAAMMFGVACGSSSAPASPSAQPAVSAAAAQSLKVTGPPLVVGDVLQFTAMATMADGSVQNVTSQSVWTTSNAAIATVSASGMVTAVKEGGVSIRATFRSVTDSEYHNVTPLLFYRTTGTVSEVPPGFNALPGARVEITLGTGAGEFRMTDGSGGFDFGTLKGGNFTFRITRDGFAPETKTVAVTRDMKIDVLLFPVPPAGATARCKDKSWSFTSDKASACSRNGGVAYWACPGPFCANP
jgi:carboxypeptidase family protein/uncharacterized protein DUF3761/Big-like domain-containing protein